ncbi:hypothetical protein ACFQ3R_07765 [Mesonia ostreae]|uniref:Uncharacterized protein n=1 Tax=Mesonia ostreae TaxID=861110 RepID=A0ABU2KM43_9FLAO|nr:hypothetical protein [Mesonia ostreae]MDT0295792.1 hypothetical protein [Mesonia ostreae]
MVVFLFSCEKENIDDTITDVATEKTVFQRAVNYDDFKSNKELFRIIAKNDNSTTQNRPGDGQPIELDYASGVYLDDHEYHSYTFPLLNPPVGENLTNVFFSFQPDGSYRIFIVEYGHTAREIERLKLDGTITSELFTYTEVDENYQALYDVQCTTITMTFSWCTEGNHPGGYPADPDCEASASDTVSYGTFCEGVGSDSFPGSSYPTSNGSTHSGGGGGSNQSTTPTTGCKGKNCLDYEISLILGYLNLSNELIDVVNNLNQSTQVEILNFIQQNLDENGSVLPEAGAFAEEVVNVLNQNPDTEIDFQNRNILHPSFKNNQKAKCVYDKLKGLSNTIFNDIIDESFGSLKNSNIQFEIGNIPAQLPPNLDAYTNTNYDENNVLGNNDNTIKIRFNPAFIQNASTIEIALILIHESIHAELTNRAIKLGIIKSVNPLGYTIFSNDIEYELQGIIFKQLLVNYNAFPPNSNSDWQHDLFNVLNYRDEMIENLLNIHPWLNDSQNDYLSNINNDLTGIGTPFTLTELFGYLSWIGLEETQEYQNQILNDTQSLSEKVYVEYATKTHYTNNCN